MKKERFENSGIGKKYLDGVPMHLEKEFAQYP